MSQHFDNPDVVTYSLTGINVADAADVRVIAPPPGKTRGRLVAIQATVTTAVVATTVAPRVDVGVSGDTDREGSLTIPDATSADVGLSAAQTPTSATQGFGFGQGNPNDQSVAAAAEDVHITTVQGTGGLVAGVYDYHVSIEWF